MIGEVEGMGLQIAIEILEEKAAGTQDGIARQRVALASDMERLVERITKDTNCEISLLDSLHHFSSKVKNLLEDEAKYCQQLSSIKTIKWIVKEEER